MGPLNSTPEQFQFYYKGIIRQSHRVFPSNEEYWSSGKNANELNNTGTDKGVVCVTEATRDPKDSSATVARMALRLAATESREEEDALRKTALGRGIKTAASDFGGDFSKGIRAIIERAIVAAAREGVIERTHVEEGALAGACREAIRQISDQALGFSIGGKLAVARQGEHISIALFFQVGLVHLNEVTVGLGHRAIPPVR